MVIREGWSGRCFEDFEVGDIYRHPLGRTITASDNTWFTLLTMNTNPAHFDHNYAAHGEFGKPIVNSGLTMAIVLGQSVTDTSQRAFANLGWDKVRLKRPVFVATRSMRRAWCSTSASPNPATTPGSCTYGLEA